MKSGMELLARDFLVAVVEGIDGDDHRDIAMRKLCFDELVRRGELSVVASIALRVYTLDKEGFYGKSIRCEAMEELAKRTGPPKGEPQASRPSSRGVSPQAGKSTASENPVELPLDYSRDGEHVEPQEVP